MWVDLLQRKTFLADGRTEIYGTVEARYIWDLALDGSGRVLVATGDPALLVRLDGEGPGRVLYRAEAESHLTCLLPHPDGGVLAGSDGQGRVNLARYFGLPEGSRRGTIFARLEIESQVEQVKRLEFGFSDRVSIFLNGSVLFTGNNTYRSRSERYLGVMTVDNDAVFLPLKRGRNKLVMAVTEAFGGWGLVARLENLLGVKVTASPPERAGT